MSGKSLQEQYANAQYVSSVAALSNVAIDGLKKAYERAIKIDTPCSPAAKRELQATSPAVNIVFNDHAMPSSHAFAAAMRACIRNVMNHILSDEMKTYNNAMKVWVGASAREIRMRREDTYSMFYIGDGSIVDRATVPMSWAEHEKRVVTGDFGDFSFFDVKDMDRIVRPLANDIVGEMRKKLVTSTYAPVKQLFVEKSPNGDLFRKVMSTNITAIELMKDIHELVKVYQLAFGMKDRIVLGGKLPKCDTVIFEDTLYDIEEDNLCKIFKETGALSGLGYMALPFELRDRKVPKSCMYNVEFFKAYASGGFGKPGLVGKYLRDGTEMAALSFVGDHSQGYAHAYDTWAKYANKMVFCSNDKSTMVMLELGVRIGIMQIVKFTKVNVNYANAYRDLTLPDYAQYSRVLRVRKAYTDYWLTKGSNFVISEEYYFSFNWMETHELIQKFISYAVEALTLEVAMNTGRNRQEGLALTTELFKNPLHLRRDDFIDLMLACYIYAVNELVKLKEIAQAVKQENSTGILARLFLRLAKQVIDGTWFQKLLQFFSGENMHRKVVVFPDHHHVQFEQIVSRAEKVSTFAYNADDLPAECATCEYCALYVPRLNHPRFAKCAKKQVMRCNGKPKYYYKFELTEADIDRIKAKIQDDITPSPPKPAPPKELKAYLEHILKIMPRSPCSRIVELDMIDGGPGTAKTDLTKACMHPVFDVALCSFKKLRNAYGKQIVPIYDPLTNEYLRDEPVDLLFKTQDVAFQIANPDHVWLEESSMYDHDKLNLLVNCKAPNKVTLIGDPLQINIMLQHGVSILSQVKELPIPVHTLAVNGRNPPEIPAILNKYLGYALDSFRIDDHVPGGSFAIVDGSKLQGVYKPTVEAGATIISICFSHDAIERVFGAPGDNTVASTQGDSYDYVVLHVWPTIESDRHLLANKEMVRVGISRHKKKLFLVHDGSLEATGWIESLGFNEREAGNKDWVKANLVEAKQEIALAKHTVYTPLHEALTPQRISPVVHDEVLPWRPAVMGRSDGPKVDRETMSPDSWSAWERDIGRLAHITKAHGISIAKIEEQVFRVMSLNHTQEYGQEFPYVVDFLMYALTNTDLKIQERELDLTLLNITRNLSVYQPITIDSYAERILALVEEFRMTKTYDELDCHTIAVLISGVLVKKLFSTHSQLQRTTQNRFFIDKPNAVLGDLLFCWAKWASKFEGKVDMEQLDPWVKEYNILGESGIRSMCGEPFYPKFSTDAHTVEADAYETAAPFEVEVVISPVKFEDSVVLPYNEPVRNRLWVEATQPRNRPVFVQQVGGVDMIIGATRVISEVAQTQHTSLEDTRVVDAILPKEALYDPTQRDDHAGQLKLFNVNSLFFKEFADPSKEYLVLYVGGAEGTHLPMLLRLFPKIKMLVVDPADMNENVKVRVIEDLEEWHEEVERDGKVQRVVRAKLTHLREPMTVSLAERIAEMRCVTLLLDDRRNACGGRIGMSGTGPTELEVALDNAAIAVTTAIICPNAASLKYRPTFQLGDGIESTIHKFIASGMTDFSAARTYASEFSQINTALYLKFNVTIEDFLLEPTCGLSGRMQQQVHASPGSAEARIFAVAGGYGTSDDPDSAIKAWSEDDALYKLGAYPEFDRYMANYNYMRANTVQRVGPSGDSFDSGKVFHDLDETLSALGWKIHERIQYLNHFVKLPWVSKTLSTSFSFDCKLALKHGGWVKENAVERGCFYTAVGLKPNPVVKKAVNDWALTYGRALFFNIEDSLKLFMENDTVEYILIQALARVWKLRIVMYLPYRDKLFEIVFNKANPAFKYDALLEDPDSHTRYVYYDGRSHYHQCSKMVGATELLEREMKTMLLLPIFGSFRGDGVGKIAPHNIVIADIKTPHKESIEACSTKYKKPLLISLPPGSGKSHLASARPDLFCDADNLALVKRLINRRRAGLFTGNFDRAYRDALTRAIGGVQAPVILHPCNDFPDTHDYVIPFDIMMQRIYSRPPDQHEQLVQWYCERKQKAPEITDEELITLAVIRKNGMFNSTTHDLLTRFVPVGGSRTKTEHQTDEQPLDDVLTAPCKDAYLNYTNFFSTAAIQPVSSLNHVQSHVVEGGFRAGSMLNSDQLMNPSFRAKPMKQEETFHQIAAGEGLRFTSLNRFSELKSARERYAIPHESKLFKEDSEAYAQKMVTKYFFQCKSLVITLEEYFNIYGDAFMHLFLIDARRKGYFKRFENEGFMDFDKRIRNVWYHQKDVFKPFVGLKGVKLDKAGQGIGAWDPALLLVFCICARIIASYDAFTDRQDEHGAVMTDSYKPTANFLQDVAKQFRNICTVPMDKIIGDVVQFDSNQDRFTQLCESIYQRALGVAETFRHLYFLFRSDMTMKSGMFEIVIEYEKISGEPMTLWGNGIVVKLLMIWIVSGRGDFLFLYKGDDTTYIQAAIEIQDFLLKEYYTYTGLRVIIKKVEVGEFCGMVMIDGLLVPNIHRILNKVIAFRARTYYDFAKYQISIRDYDIMFRSLGEANVVKACASLKRITYEEAYGIYDCLRSFGHINERQWRGLISQVKEEIFVPHESGGVLIVQ